MTSSLQDLARTEYDSRAQAYLVSPVHESGADLDQLEAFVRRHAPARVLDLGCGGGHVSYRAAPFAAQVTACDPAPRMLQTVADAAAARGLTNIATHHSTAEQLVLPDLQDMVLSRYSAHHWADLQAGLRAARAATRPGGTALFIDTAAPAAPLLDTHLQTIELLRDPSHVRNYTAAQWLAALGQAGWRVTSLTARRLRLDFPSWIARTDPGPLAAQAIRAVQTRAPAEVQSHFHIEPDGSWTLHNLAIEAAAA